MLHQALGDLVLSSGCCLGFSGQLIPQAGWNPLQFSLLFKFLLLFRGLRPEVSPSFALWQGKGSATQLLPSLSLSHPFPPAPVFMVKMMDHTATHMVAKLSTTELYP